jgi:hypothetical protein
MTRPGIPQYDNKSPTPSPVSNCSWGELRVRRHRWVTQTEVGYPGEAHSTGNHQGKCPWPLHPPGHTDQPTMMTQQNRQWGWGEAKDEEDEDGEAPTTTAGRGEER